MAMTAPSPRRWIWLCAARTASPWLPEATWTSSCGQVWLPTSPSTAKPREPWNASTADFVCGPKIPSTITAWPCAPSRYWMVLTSSPVEPAFTSGHVSAIPFLPLPGALGANVTAPQGPCQGSTLDAQAAVDDDRSAGHEGALLAGQEHDRVSDLVRAGVASERNHLFESFGRVLTRGADGLDLDCVLEVIVGRSRVQRVDPDPLAGHLFGRRAHQPDQGVLGRGIGAYRLVGGDANDAGVDDQTASGLHYP